MKQRSRTTVFLLTVQTTMQKRSWPLVTGPEGVDRTRVQQTVCRNMVTNVGYRGPLWHSVQYVVAYSGFMANDMLCRMQCVLRKAAQDVCPRRTCGVEIWVCFEGDLNELLLNMPNIMYTSQCFHQELLIKSEITCKGERALDPCGEVAMWDLHCRMNNGQHHSHASISAKDT